MIFQKSDSKSISNAFLSGSVGIMPSDTVFGIFACALNQSSVRRVYSIKNRDLNKPFILLISDVSDLNIFGIDLSTDIRSILNKYWPGPLSVIFDCNDDKLEYLHRGKKSLAVRLPRDDWLLSIIRKTGPLVAPSANLQGEKTVESAIEASDFYVDGEVKIEKGKLAVLRQGSIELV